MTKLRVIEDFLYYLKSTDKSTNTIRNYRCDLANFANWFYNTNNEQLALRKITPTDIRQYKQKLLDLSYKPQTINRRLLSLKSFLEWGWDTKDIGYRFPIPKLIKRTVLAPKWLNKLEQNTLLRHMEKYASQRDLAIVKIILNTGLRVSELCNLKWSDVIVTERKGNLTVHQGKGNKYREIPLNKDARNAFLNIKYKNHSGSDSQIFIGQRGPITERAVQLMLRKQLKNTDIFDITPHQLRHSFCKNLVNAEVSLEKIAALAGHESLDTTKLYCQPSLSDLNTAVAKIGEEE
jgi:integrase/recombinase XerC